MRMALSEVQAADDLVPGLRYVVEMHAGWELRAF
jgi:hypothetical protein